LKRKLQGYGDTFFIDKVFVKINSKQHDLWRAIDQDGEVVDVFFAGTSQWCRCKTLPQTVIAIPWR